MSRSKPTDTIKFLLDENVPRGVKVFLSTKGYNVVFVPKGLKNGAVIHFSKEDKRVLITQDTDFSHPTLHPKRLIYAIIIFRIHPPDSIKLIASLNAFLTGVDTIEGNRFLLDEHGYSIIEE